MYSLPSLKQLIMPAAAGFGIASSLLLSGCATTSSKNKPLAQQNEALYLFDDGTGDLPAVDSYAANDPGPALDFTETEQVQPTRNTGGGNQTLYAANTAPTAPGPAYGGGGSDVLSTPPMPVTPGTNYGPSYSDGDSGAPEPVASTPAPTKKKASTKSSTRTYVVKRGDTLSGIASRYGTSVTSIKNLNGMSGTRIIVGQKLKVGGSGSGARATATSGKKRASSHTVRSGDNLWDISRRYGVSITALKKANGMSNSTIRPGQKLKLP